MTDHELKEQLARLEAEWRRQGAPVADRVAAGLTDERIDELIEPVGIVLPESLRTWWRWHNGLTGSPLDYDFGPGFVKGAIGPGVWTPLSLELAIAYYAREPRYGGEQNAEDPSWQDSWFPFAKFGLNQDVLFVDTAASPNPPVRVWWNFDRRGWDVNQAPSLADAVAIWVRALSEGYFRWDPRTQTWQERVADLPPELHNSLTT